VSYSHVAGKRPVLRTLSKKALPYALIAPAVLVVATVLIYPMLNTAWRSFFTWPFSDPDALDFVALGNYAALAASDQFWSAARFTIVFTVATLIVEFLAGLGGALVIDQLRRGRGAVMSITIAPYMVAPIAVGLIWRLMLQRESGVINYLAGFFGIEPVSWLSDTLPAIAAMIMAESWKSIPFVLLIQVAGLAAIPDDLTEATRIDGATEWGVFRHLKLPLLAPYIAIALIFETVFKLRVFDLALSLTGGGPGSDTTPLGILVQRLFFRYFDGGEAAAVSVVLLVMGAFVAFFYLRYIYREIKY
jgi:multiple sugar transport system permease protein